MQPRSVPQTPQLVTRTSTSSARGPSSSTSSMVILRRVSVPSGFSRTAALMRIGVLRPARASVAVVASKERGRAKADAGQQRARQGRVHAGLGVGAAHDMVRRAAMHLAVTTGPEERALLLGRHGLAMLH